MTSKVGSDNMMGLYSKFLSFGTKNEQDVYLQSEIEVHPIVRKLQRLSEDYSNSKRKPKDRTYKYWLASFAGHIKYVSLHFYLSMVYPMTEHEDSDLSVSGKAPQDMCGKQ
ncbi:hypothetical protein PR048_009431 [Dryococelus australis]|uniref:Uncharacterized protein n=1 Tax=Dryococelus australis TaxID=614101 RepID=A0ABQ9I0L1_9NEOP|nr:hypothetical protein PR048_009431 [Dryococelus australis]